MIADEKLEKREPLHAVGGNANSKAVMEQSMENPEIEISMWKRYLHSHDSQEIEYWLLSVNG